MSETKFTPGPWRVVHSDGEVYVRDVGGLIAKGAKPHLWEGQDARFTEELGQYVANAALIAASPDLYAALVKAKSDLEWYEQRITGESYNSPSINAALAKARGE
jgi:hypothetical protein